LKIIDPPIIVVQIFNISADQVWKAITNVDLMRRWFFDNIESFDPEVGFATEFAVQNGGSKFYTSVDIIGSYSTKEDDL